MKSNFKDRLFDLLEELSKSSVKFVVCGGVACVLQGVERATYDLDIAVSFSKEDIDKLIKITRKYNLIPRIPEPVEYLYDGEKRKNWVKKKNALVYTFISKDGPLQLDIFLKYPIPFEDLIKNADAMKVGNILLLVSSVKDLLYAKSKIKPLRDKDRLDIRELKKLLSGDAKKTK